jgi:hypothetical protein
MSSGCRHCGTSAVIASEFIDERRNSKFITMPRPLSASDGTGRPSLNYARTVNFSIGHATKMSAVLDDMEKVSSFIQLYRSPD